MIQGIVNQVNYRELTGELVVEVMHSPALQEYTEDYRMELGDAVTAVAAQVGKSCLTVADVTRDCQPTERRDQYLRHFRAWHNELRGECSDAFAESLLRHGVPEGSWSDLEADDKAFLKAQINSQDDLQILNGLRRAVYSYTNGRHYWLAHPEQPLETVPA